ncbi:MAG: Rrf2 family transcriptional regulator [bacterium]|nr:Rrf2 family transcriptional regulator [bacterium]
MKIPTRVQYGVRLMLQLALRTGQGYAFLHDIARRENLSEKYLSLIAIPLRAHGLIDSTRGTHGGYRLAKPPAQITVLDIVRVLQGDIEVVRPERGTHQSTPGAVCIEREVWRTLEKTIRQTLAGITLASLAEAYQRQISSALTYEI